MVSVEVQEQAQAQDVPRLPEWLNRFLILVNQPRNDNDVPFMRVPNQRQVEEAEKFVEDNPDAENGIHYAYAYWYSGATTYVVRASQRWWSVMYDPRDDSIVFCNFD